MSVSEVAQSLVSLCRAGHFEEAYKTLYSPEIKSVEANGETVQGMDGIQGKMETWSNMFDVKDTTVGNAFVGHDQFAVPFKLEVVEKATGNTMTLDEIAVYTVRDGKIVEENFLDPAKA